MEDITIDSVKKQVQAHLDDLEWLSKSIVDLAVLGFRHNVLLTNAEINEGKKFLEAKNEQGVKVTIEEAKIKAMVETSNEYGLLKLDREQLEILINTIKLRIRVLLGEKDSSNTI